MDEALLDTIYETVLHPQLWDDVLRRLADGIGAEGGAMVWQDVYTNATSAIFGRTDPEAIKLFSGYFATRNPLRLSADKIRRKIESWKPQIILDQDQMAKDEFEKTEFYNDFFRRFDYHSSAAVGLEVDGRNGATLDLMKSRRAGDFDQADMDLIREAQPHLVRAFKAGREVASAKGGLGTVVAEAFDEWPCGVLVLSPQCRVLFANAVAESFARTGNAIRIINGVLSAVDAVAAPRLEALVKRAAEDDEAGRAGGFLAVPTSARDRLPLSLSITPLRTDRHPLFGQSAVLVTVTDPARELVLSPQKLREVFGLTATEVKVAMGLFGGQATGDVADQLGISMNTVRNHLAHILEKTHSSGQAELSRRMMTLA